MPRQVPVSVLPGCRGRITVAELRRAARHVLAAEQVASDVAVDIVLADADTVHDLNRLYRGRDEPTDVLSFATMDYAALDARFGDEAASEPAPTAFVDAPDESLSLGEVIICLPVAEAQAATGGRPVAGEIVHLLVHGLLHLIGHDHEEAADAAEMQSREDELLAALGYAGQYAHGH